MRNTAFGRRSLFGSLFALHFQLTAQSRQGSISIIAKVGAGAGRLNSVGKLPGGDLLYVKVATQDARGALFMTEQPVERAGSGPPKHYHEYQDEWFYCLAGEYLFEIGDQRFRLGAGESVLGPRRVPHAFLSTGPGRLLIGFTPAGHMEQFFRDIERRGQYFGNGTSQDKDTAHRQYGIVNVGPRLTL